ncbi:MAG TPA: lactonase family protein [Bacteroidales bacterium]|nr:lactonase family protein [Bacteroidales bacterium]
MKNYLFLFILSGLILFSTGCKKKELLYAGRFTKGDEKGLYIFSFNPSNGSLKLKSQEDVGPSPSFFCFGRNNDLLYVINEVMEFKGAFGGGLTTLKLDTETGRPVEKLSEILVPYAGPCHISLSADGRHILIANYPNGSVVVIRLGSNGIPEAVTDTILYVKEEPDRSHAHMIKHDPAGKYIYVTDLGLDRIVTYTLDTINSKLVQTSDGIASLPQGSGPRHFEFNNDGSVMYVINELGSTITVFSVDRQSGALTALQTVKTISDDYIENNYCAEIALSKNGKFLYGSNRGENTIIVFKVGEGGKLELTGRVSCGGDWPRNFVIHPEGKFLLVGNQKSGYISVFKINQMTGLPEGPVAKAEIPGVAFLAFK